MKIMKADELAKLLRRLAEMVETGDSLEGSLQYTYYEALEGAPDGSLQVEGALRTGNREGQGGMVLL